MFRSLLNSLPTVGVFAVIIGFTTLVSVVSAYVVSVMAPNLGESHYEKLSDAIKAVFALLFGLIFALSMANISSKASEAASVASAEATSLAQLVRSTRSFAIPERIPARRAIREYDRAVVEDEWQTMRGGKASPRVDAALDNLYAVYQSYLTRPNPTSSLASAGLAKIDQVVASRRARLDQSQSQLPGLLRFLLVVGVIFFIILSYPASLEARHMRLLAVGGIAAFLSFAFALTVILDYPYSGALAVDNQIYQQGALGQFFVLNTPPAPLASLHTRKARPQDIVGEWSSALSKNGIIVFRNVDGEIHGVYRADNGSFVGKIDPDGVLRGWWCEEPSRQIPEDAGEVEWRLFETVPDQRTMLDGRWRYGNMERFRNGWSLDRVQASEPSDLGARFSDLSASCRHP
jgi:ABC-type multidrug transport system fused ATPase/permease subunit